MQGKSSFLFFFFFFPISSVRQQDLNGADEETPTSTSCMHPVFFFLCLCRFLSVPKKSSSPPPPPHFGLAKKKKIVFQHPGGWWELLYSRNLQVWGVWRRQKGTERRWTATQGCQLAFLNATQSDKSGICWKLFGIYFLGILPSRQKVWFSTLWQHCYRHHHPFYPTHFFGVRWGQVFLFCSPTNFFWEGGWKPISFSPPTHSAAFRGRKCRVERD